MKLLQGGTWNRLTTERSFDNWNRLRSMAVTPSGGASLGLDRGFSYDGENQRKRQTLEDGGYRAYKYDVFGQAKTGNDPLKDGMSVRPTPEVGRSCRSAVNSPVASVAPRAA